MNHTELVMRRRVFDAFVKADPVMVAFSRRTVSVRTAAGGLATQPDRVLGPQQGRIVQSKNRYSHGLINSEAGDIPKTEYLLLGRHTMDVEANDTFFWAGDNYKVIGIHPTRTESKLCAIEFLGPVNGPS